MSRSLVFDLLAGLPRVALSRSHCLNGEVTTPFGQEPSQEGVEAKWRSLAGGDRETPPWIILGQRETPSGIVWGIQFCPASGPLPERAELVLPIAAWIRELMEGIQGPPGWHVRLVKVQAQWWGAVWEGERCDRVHGPLPTREDAQARCLHGIEDGSPSDRPVLEASWRDPDRLAMSRLAAEQASADLLSLDDSLQRARLRKRQVAFARLGGISLVFLLICGLFGLFQFGAGRMRSSQESRLAQVKMELETVDRLESRSRSLVDSLNSRRAAMLPNSSADLVLRSISKAVPATVKLQVFAMEPVASGFRARLEAKFPEWSQVQPFTEALRTVPGVRKVAVVSQARQSEDVLAVLELEGDWP